MCGEVPSRYRIRGQGAPEYRASRGFARIPTDLAPGEDATFWVGVLPPPKPGVYDLILCLRQDDGDDLAGRPGMDGGSAAADPVAGQPGV